MDEELKMKIRQLIKAGEGCIEHMYLNTVGKVTVGVDNMLPNVAARESRNRVTMKCGNCY